MARIKTTVLASAFAAVAAASTGTIKDIEHVVLFMQENRALDHYFGTMAGVRGFKDPNVQVNNGTPLWYQTVDSSLSTATKTLLPWYLNYLGGTWDYATQCMTAGSNGWSANHAALNGDLNNNWPVGNTPYSWAHFTRKDIPNHFAIAEGWTIGDMYQESVVSSTNPNRAAWVSGNIQDGSSVYIDNNETPGCDLGGKTNCYPLTWKTAPENYQDQGVTWQVYQDTDNFDDNPLAWFKQYQEADNSSALSQRGLVYNGLEKFYEDAANGNLPEVSYIIGPAELSEHPPYQPRDGGWLWQKIVDTVTSSPKYSSTALIISYDETGGFGDHVTPYHSPAGTAQEWIEDPYGKIKGQVYTGPGFRVPFVIVSPWTRGGHVYTEHADHSSQIKFIEQWQLAKGKNVTLNTVAPWRRQNMADLTKAFDFANPDYSIPEALNATYPSTDKNGNWNGYSVCQSTYNTTKPPVPYGKQNISTALATESGFKSVRGQLTEGRYLVFELNGRGLAVVEGKLSSAAACPEHSEKSQRFVAHQHSSNKFSLTSAVDGKVVVAPGESASNATVFMINDLSSGKGHSLQNSVGQYLTIGYNGEVAFQQQVAGFKLFSVSYDN
ncbi:hypothetical protein AMS68_004918 [Peltaster fructicola]|uniref:Phospholipase C n=1 Tax=Peltaster fructicola TaxID=286661 RepID=A0A6H0XXL1_9PEZI|nr:hypothetical protein AMS68_004918 [Peltaster fructicola]